MGAILPEPDFSGIEDARSAFAESSELAAAISDQNTRRRNIDTHLTDDDFKAVVNEGLVSEQQDTLELLELANDEAPYEEVIRASMSTEASIEAKTRQLIESQAEIEVLNGKIEAEAQAAIKLAPYKEKEIEALAKRKKDQVNETFDTSNLISDLTELLDYQKELETLVVEGGASWEIPFLKFEQLAVAQVVEIITEDNIPVEPEIHTHPSESVERTFAIESPQATADLIEYFVNNVGITITVEDLSTMLYKRKARDADEESTLRSRVTTLLGPAKHGPELREVLGKYGLVFEYGWRQIKTIFDSGEVKLSQPKRIYRVINESEVTEEDLDIEETETTIDKWLTAKRVSSIGGVPVVQEVEAVLEPFEGRTTPEQSTEKRKVFRFEPVTKESDKSEEPERVEKKWMKDFRKDVLGAIDALEKEHLLQLDPMTQIQLSRRSNSRKMGTDEALKRLLNAKIISRAAFGARKLIAREIVAMYMFNTHSSTLSRKQTMKQALGVIDEELDRFWERQS